MAFNTKYKIEGTSDVFGLVTILIKEDGYLGSVQEFDAASRDFVNLKIGNGGDDISKSILSSRLKVQFYVLEDFVSLDLADSEFFKFMVEVNDDQGDNIWSGWVDSEDYSEQYISSPYVVTLGASDFLDGLKNVELASLLGTKNNLWTVLRTALAGTNLELRYLESVSIYSNGMSQNDQDSPFTQAELINETWLDKTCYEVIEAIVKPLFARVYQFRGWRIENIIEKRDNHTIRLYDQFGVYQAFFNSLSLKTLDNSPLSFSKFLGKSGALNFKPALNKSRAYFFGTQEKQNESGLLGFDKLSDWIDTTNLVSWTKENGINISRIVTEYNGSQFGVYIVGRNLSFADDQYIQSIAFPVDPINEQSITVGFDYKMNYPSIVLFGSKPILYFEIFLDAPTKDYWWTGSDWVEVRKTLRISASPRNSWRNYEVTIPVLPEAGNIFFRIHKLVKKGSEGVTELFLTKWTSNIKAQVEQSDVYFYDQGITNITSSYKGPVFEHFISDGLILGAKGVLEVGGVLTSSWRRKGVTESLSLRRLFLLQWLSMNQNPTAILSGTLYQRGEQIRPSDTIRDDPSVSDKRYIMTSWSVSLGSGRGEIEYREIPMLDSISAYSEGTSDSIRQEEYLIRGAQPATAIFPNPKVDQNTPRIPFNRGFNGDITGDQSAIELTPSAIVNKRLLDLTGLNPEDIVFNAVRNSNDQEAMTNLRVSDLAQLVIPDHNDTTNKQGGDGTNFIHLGQNDFNEVQDILNPTKAGFDWISRVSAADLLWNSVAFGNNTFVAVASIFGSGDLGRVMTSPDGKIWTLRNASVANNWIHVTFGNGIFVAVANSGTGNRVMTSPDGITWTTRSSVADINWNCVVFGNGLFVAVGGSATPSGHIMTSPDGITWTARTPSRNNHLNWVTFGNGLFVVTSISIDADSVMTSPDGINWTTRTAVSNINFITLTFGNNLFVAISDTGNLNNVMTSPDGIIWTQRNGSISANFRCIAFGNGLFVALGLGGLSLERLMTSPDGITWTTRIPATLDNWKGVIYGLNIWVAVSGSGTGNRVMTSSDNNILKHSSLILDDGKNPHGTRFEDLLGIPPTSDRNVDGGEPDSVYLPSQKTDGGEI